MLVVKMCILYKRHRADAFTILICPWYKTAHIVTLQWCYLAGDETLKHTCIPIIYVQIDAYIMTSLMLLHAAIFITPPSYMTRK